LLGHTRKILEEDAAGNFGNVRLPKSKKKTDSHILARMVDAWFAAYGDPWLREVLRKEGAADSYMEQLPPANAAARRICVHWVFRVVKLMTCSPSVVFLAIQFLDEYCRKKACVPDTSMVAASLIVALKVGRHVGARVWGMGLEGAACDD
jgi:hypothetical protein